MVGGALSVRLGLDGGAPSDEGADADEREGRERARGSPNRYRAWVSVLSHQIVSAAPGSAGARQKQMLLLHGIFGAGRNWASVARRLTAARPDWRVVLVDLRRHGRSSAFPPPHTLEACVRDLVRLEEHLGTPSDAVLGHSFGGKVALLHANPGQTWVVDSAPGRSSLDPAHPRGAVWRMLYALRQNPGPFADRRHAAETIRAEGFSRLVANWMATNVVEGRSGSGWRWRIDPDDMEALLRDYARIDAWRAVEAPPPGASVHIVKARASQVFDAPDLERIRSAGERTGRVFLHEIDGGHWLNVENPTALHRLLADGLAQRFS